MIGKKSGNDWRWGPIVRNFIVWVTLTGQGRSQAYTQGFKMVSKNKFQYSLSVGAYLQSNANIGTGMD